jgi:hypothetical protein
VSTNTFEFYRDNGTTWDLIGGPGTSTVTGTGANGQVTYWNGTSSITGSNDLFFDAVNGHLGVGTITPGTALDVKHNQSTVVQLEQETATNDTRIAFINSGVGLWRLGAFYNAGANDFGLFDIAAAAQPVTVKRTTGQVLIGTSTVGSGKLVVASATGDNGVQIVGASAPSLRIDNAESGPTKRAGLGISTAANNFIQGSVDRDFCIFNGSTAAASPMLFGIYDAGTGNVQEAARISAARNFLVGTITDPGIKFVVQGNTRLNGNATVGAITYASAISGSAQGLMVTDTTTFNVASVRVNGGSQTTSIELFGSGTSTGLWGSTNNPIDFVTNNVQAMRISASQNLLIGGTTDSGQKLQVNGTTYISGNLGIGSTSPTAKLEILDGGGASLTVGATVGTAFVYADNSAASIGTLTNTPLRLVTNNTIRITLKNSGVLNFTSIPTSAVGLVSGDIYSNLGILTIVP